MQRRSFLRVAGATAASSALVLAGCGDDPVTPPTSTPGVFALSGDDTGLLNLLYILEQLEAAFYQKVLDALPTDLQPGDKEALTALRDHEVIHREFFSYALTNSVANNLVFDFSSLTLTTRAGVFAAAKKLEDVGVAAYASLAKRFSSVAYVKLIAKIASVEARHAAFVRDVVQANSLGTPDDTIISTSGEFGGLNTLLTPAQLVAAIAPFISFTIDASKLPAN